MTYFRRVFLAPSERVTFTTRRVLSSTIFFEINFLRALPSVQFSRFFEQFARARLIIDNGNTPLYAVECERFGMPEFSASLFYPGNFFHFSEYE